MLECIQGSISALESEPENPVNQLKIDHLRNQAEEVKGDIRFYQLCEEMRHLEAQNHLDEKILRLQNEIQSLYGVEPKFIITTNQCSNCSCRELFSESCRRIRSQYRRVENNNDGNGNNNDGNDGNNMEMDQVGQGQGDNHEHP